MPRSAAATRSLFDGWAGSYDDDLRDAGGPLAGYASSLRQAARMLPLAAGADVLDVGIGTGAFAALLAERGARITGLDVSDEMLARCRAAHPDFTLHVGSFEPIPLPDARFDAAVASFAFHEVPPASRPAVVAELARVLKPGGHLCVLDIVFASEAATADARRAIDSAWDDDEDYPLVADLDAMLRDAGFVEPCWRQTAMCHWAVVARRDEPPVRPAQSVHGASP